MRRHTAFHGLALSPRGRRAGALLVIVASTTLGVSVVTPTSADAMSCAVVVNGKVGAWTQRPAPTFPAGGQALVSHAVVSQSPSDQYVTNGVSIMRTSDGCSWREAMRLPEQASLELPATAETDRVLELVVHPRNPRSVWAVVALGQSAAERAGLNIPLSPARDERRDGTRALVLRSSDGGTTWQAGPQALMEGTPGQLAVSPSDEDRLYLPTALGLHTSVDGGRTWRPLPPALPPPTPGGKPLDAVTSPLLTHVTVDPMNPEALYGRTSTLVRSENGGQTWTSYGLPPGHVSGPFIDLRSSRFVTSLQEFSTSPVQSLWFQDGGAVAVQERPVAADSMLGVPWRAAWHPTQDELVVATWDRNSAAAFPDTSLYRVDDHGGIQDINDLDLPFVRGVVVDDAGTYHLHTANELVTVDLGAAPAPEPQVEVDPFATPPAPSPEPAALATPSRLEVTPGGTAPLDVTLSLPKRPTPLDVYFMVDTSNSFEPDIQALADGMGEVVRALGRDGVDAWFGIGEVGTREARRYRRFADITPPGRELRRGFERLRIGGSTESHLISLHQAATGAGLTGTSGPSVAEGQDPNWRRGSLRTVVVITDVEYTDEGDPDAPTRQQVYGALADRDVRVIGMEVVREGGDDGVPGGYAAVEGADAASTTFPTPARRDLEELAAATGSFAPHGGVDCRGNGTVEIAAGDPLVCTTTALHVARISTLSDVLRRVLAAQTDRQPVELQVSSTAQVSPATPQDWKQVLDVRIDHPELRYAGSVGCTAEQAGELLPITIRALVAGRQVAQAEAELQCGAALPKPAPDAPAPPVAGSPAAAGQPISPQGALVPPAVPPAVTVPVGGTAPAPGTAPGTSSAPGSASAPGASGAGAVASAEEEDLSLAAASLAMTSDRHAAPMPPWVTATATLMTAGTAGALLRRDRRRPRLLPARKYDR